jgi:putative peptidoglycan lipid II flippase
MIVNVAFSLALFPSMAEAGIALATTIAGWTNAVLLFALLVRKGYWPMDAAVFRQMGLMLASALAMAAVLYGLMSPVADLLRPQAGVGSQMAGLALLVLCGAALYFVLVQVTGGADLRALARQISRRPN